MKKLLILALLPLMNITIAKTSDEMATKFLSKINETPQEAMDEIIKDGPLASPIMQVSVNTMSNQVTFMIPQTGKKIDVPAQKLAERDISDSMKQIIYMQKYEKMPVIWYFSFYKANDDWTLQKIFFNTDIPVL